MSNRGVDLYDDGIGCVELVDSLGGDLSVVNSARVSFGVHKEVLEEKDKKLIKYLIKHRHTSTLEHCVITFRFKVPIFIRSQHHRHRTWSYNEISRRYTDVNLEFYEPKEFRTQHKSNRQASNESELTDPLITYGSDSWGWSDYASKLVEKHHRSCVEFYNALLRSGVCREQARGVLPQNMYTEYYGTVNLNNLLKFVDLRTHDGAQWEIQKVAEVCLKIAEEVYPITVRAYRELR
jgi:thymidylate synthase (FAD)